MIRDNSDFCNTIPTIINGSIRNIDKSNLNYIVPHRIIINNVMFLAFNYSSESNEALTLRLENFTKNIKK